MDYELTENQTWVLALLFIVYQPMVATKTGRYPLSQIISQFAGSERAKVRRGIDALLEMNIFVLVGQDICITDKSESLLQALNHIVGKPAGEVENMLKTLPAFSSILAKINSDSRFAPPSESQPIPQRSESADRTPPAPAGTPIGIGGKIILGIFFLVILLSLMKLIFRY